MDRVEQRLAEVAAELPALREFTLAIAKDAVLSAEGTLMLGHAPNVAQPDEVHAAERPLRPLHVIRGFDGRVGEAQAGR